ncbi:hypothetical protein DFH06DRAFT_1139499 [Mycena polygramma]|nr:hypothetical protein DFH06DRAFT_1139499 [Mycena polygramma]
MYLTAILRNLNVYDLIAHCINYFWEWVKGRGKKGKKPRVVLVGSISKARDPRPTFGRLEALAGWDGGLQSCETQRVTPGSAISVHSFGDQGEDKKCPEEVLRGPFGLRVRDILAKGAAYQSTNKEITNTIITIIGNVSTTRGIRHRPNFRFLAVEWMTKNYV